MERTSSIVCSTCSDKQVSLYNGCEMSCNTQRLCQWSDASTMTVKRMAKRFTYSVESCASLYNDCKMIGKTKSPIQWRRHPLRGRIL